MKKVTVFVMALVLLLEILPQACAAKKLKYADYWIALREPSMRFDHRQFLADLDAFAADHPMLMYKKWLDMLIPVAEKCVELEKNFTREEDPFEGGWTLWPSALQRPGEEELFVPFISSGGVKYTFVTIDRAWWMSTDKAVFLSDAGERLTETYRPSENEFVIGYSSDHSHLEACTSSLGYKGWHKLLDGAGTVSVRYYGSNGRTIDYQLTEDQLQAFRQCLELYDARDELNGLLQFWCEAVEVINEKR